MEYTRWIEVNKDAIRHNYREIRARLAPQVKLLGVVKADAYGHGALETAQVLEEQGIDMLGVTSVEEGTALRRDGIKTPILVFGPFLEGEAPTILQEDLTVTAAGYEAISWLGQALKGTDQSIKVHLKIETGLGRTGFWPREAAAAAAQIREIPGLFLEGVYSHLATAMAGNKAYAEKQLSLLLEAVDNLNQAGISGLITHIANSSAILNLPHMHLDMVRAGTILYGQYPSPAFEGSLHLRDPWAFKAKVIHISVLPPRHTIGYGRTYRTRRKTRVAILPVGFTDGVQLEPVFKPAGLWELVKGIAKLILIFLGHPRAVPPVAFPSGRGRIRGKVGMQLTMVDVTGLDGVETGTTALVPARRTAVSSAIPRIYIEDRQADLLVDQKVYALGNNFTMQE